MEIFNFICCFGSVYLRRELDGCDAMLSDEDAVMLVANGMDFSLQTATNLIHVGMDGEIERRYDIYQLLWYTNKVCGCMGFSFCTPLISADTNSTQKNSGIFWYSCGLFEFKR